QHRGEHQRVAGVVSAQLRRVRQPEPFDEHPTGTRAREARVPVTHGRSLLASRLVATHGGAVQTVRRVAILGGNRIPFARANSRYAAASSQDMLTAALDGLIARFGLAGERVGEVVAGAVLKHARDFNLTREVVLGSRLDPRTPAYDIQQACGTGLEAVI